MMKSWEGELVMEGLKGNSQRITNVWKFSVLNAQVASVIENAAMSGKSVALKYCQRNPMVAHPDIDTDYEITQAVGGGEIVYWIGALATLFLVPFLVGKYSDYKADNAIELFLVGMMMLLAMVWSVTLASLVGAAVFKFSWPLAQESSWRH